MTTRRDDRFTSEPGPAADEPADVSLRTAALLAAVLGLEPELARRVRAAVPRRRGPACGGGQHGPALDLGS